MPQSVSEDLPTPLPEYDPSSYVRTIESVPLYHRWILSEASEAFVPTLYPSPIRDSAEDPVVVHPTTYPVAKFIPINWTPDLTVLGNSCRFNLTLPLRSAMNARMLKLLSSTLELLNLELTEVRVVATDPADTVRFVLKTDFKFGMDWDLPMDSDTLYRVGTSTHAHIVTDPESTPRRIVQDYLSLIQEVLNNPPAKYHPTHHSIMAAAAALMGAKRTCPCGEFGYIEAYPFLHAPARCPSGRLSLGGCSDFNIPEHLYEYTHALCPEHLGCTFCPILSTLFMINPGSQALNLVGVTPEQQAHLKARGLHYYSFGLNPVLKEQDIFERSVLAASPFPGFRVYTVSRTLDSFLDPGEATYSPTYHLSKATFGLTKYRDLPWYLHPDAPSKTELPVHPISGGLVHVWNHTMNLLSQSVHIMVSYSDACRFFKWAEMLGIRCPTLTLATPSFGSFALAARDRCSPREITFIEYGALIDPFISAWIRGTTQPLGSAARPLLYSTDPSLFAANDVEGSNDAVLTIYEPHMEHGSMGEFSDLYDHIHQITESIPPEEDEGLEIYFVLLYSSAATESFSNPSVNNGHRYPATFAQLRLPVYKQVLSQKFTHVEDFQAGSHAYSVFRRNACDCNGAMTPLGWGHDPNCVQIDLDRDASHPDLAHPGQDADTDTNMMTNPDPAGPPHTPTNITYFTLDPIL